MAYKNKIKKTIRLYPETYEMLEAYRGKTGEDFTNGLESLLIKGLENNHTSQLLFKKLKNEVDKLLKLQKNSDERIIKILIFQLRLLGEIKALSKVHIVKSELVEQDEANEYMNQGIKSAFKDLQKRELI
jgi:hypothetical protein